MDGVGVMVGVGLEVLVMEGVNVMVEVGALMVGVRVGAAAVCVPKIAMATCVAVSGILGGDGEQAGNVKMRIIPSKMLFAMSTSHKGTIYCLQTIPSDE
jgi:hypothetical protein